MDWLLLPIRDLIVWFFENTLEPLSGYPNTIFLLLGFGGATYWMLTQNKLNKKADKDPEQIK
tara:strand:- start:355 stop:540 length:186 start_codon:yes stop_codon:yes gene_type:complete